MKDETSARQAKNRGGVFIVKNMIGQCEMFAHGLVEMAAVPLGPKSLLPWLKKLFAPLPETMFLTTTLCIV